jgi:hypothetical protein
LVATHFPNTKECQYVADTATAAAAVPATTAAATAAAKEKDHHNKKEQTDYKSYFSGTQFTRSGRKIQHARPIAGDYVREKPRSLVVWVHGSPAKQM